MATKTALVLLASGAEEMEAVISIDVLRRAKVNVTVAGLEKDEVTCSRGVKIIPDQCLKDMTEQLYDVVVLPGGLGGAKKLAESSDVKAVLQRHNKAGKLIAAICAAPTALATHGICAGKRITSYPTLKDKFNDYHYSEDRVVRDGNLITSRGPGTAFEFALQIVQVLHGSTVVSQLTEEMLIK